MQCASGHEFVDLLSNLASYREKGCPVCRGKKVVTGLNDLKSQAPAIATYYHEANPLLPEEIFVHRKRRVLWCCSKSDAHVFSQSVKERVLAGEACSQCRKEKITEAAKEKMRESVERLNLYYSNLNENSFASTKIGDSYLWNCPQCNHFFENVLKNSAKKKNPCPKCSPSRKVLVRGVNDLASVRPDVSVFWHGELNRVSPEEVFSKSNAYHYWYCEEGHTYRAQVNYRTSKRWIACPVCNSTKLLTGYNDLATLHPELVNEWSSKNSLPPEKVLARSAESFYWVCEKNHQWRSPLRKDCGGRRSDCPICNASTSAPELELLQLVKELLPDYSVEHQTRQIIPPYELDIYVPALKKALEFNGSYWHSDEVVKRRTGRTASEYHSMKTSLCEATGVDLLHVGEEEWLTSRGEVEALVSSFLGKVVEEG